MTKIFTSLTLILFLGLTGLTAQQSWYELSPMPGFTRHHPICFSLDGQGYLLCGNADQAEAGVPYLRDFYTYDPDTDQWTKLADFPGAPRGFGVGLSYNGKGYVGFGFGNNQYLDDLWEYDPATNTWTRLPSCPCAGRIHPAFVAARGKVYVGLGGTGRNENDWWSYDIEDRQWTQEQNFPAEPRHHPYYFSVGETPYVGFGHSGPPSAIHKDFYKFDPVLRQWQKMKDFPSHARVAGTHFEYNNKGYILAGDGATHGYDVGEFWEYDPVNDFWQQLPTFPEDGRWAPGCFEIDGTVYFTSGFARNTGVLHKDLWGYDLKISTDTKDAFISPLSAQPNPVRDRLQLNQLIKGGKYEITDLSGHQMMAWTATDAVKQIDVSHLANGLYIIRGVDVESASIRFIKL